MSEASAGGSGVAERSREGGRGLYILLLAVPLVPLALLMAEGYSSQEELLTERAGMHLRPVADLSSRLLGERLRRLQDLSLSLATRVRFRQLVSEGNWTEAIGILGDVRGNFPFVDRILLADPGGKLRADIPAAPEVQGADFSHRDWYRGAMVESPYVSEVYRRKAKPSVNVLACSCLIRNDRKETVGILVVQVTLRTLLEWCSEIDVGPSGFLYVLDHHGGLAAHPGVDPERDVENVLDRPGIQRALATGHALGVAEDPVSGKECLTCSATVPGVGWRVVAAQPTAVAFAAREAELRRLLFKFGLLVLLAGAMTWLLVRAVTARDRAAAQVRALNEELAVKAAALDAANKDLESFSYSVSHDLRAPLRAIIGFGQALEEDSGHLLDASGKQHLRLIRSEAARMGALIDDLLRLSRVLRAELRHEEVDLAAIAREVVEGLRRADPGREVEVVIPPELPARGDAALLRAVLQNLLENAWKFTSRRARARIEVGREVREGECVYYVRDDGEGFDPAYVHKLFGAFQRLHPASEFPGTGIGLATVHRIVRRHGGRVWAEGAPGKGATFSFVLGGQT